jgi:hypothetical protein
MLHQVRTTPTLGFLILGLWNKILTDLLEELRHVVIKEKRPQPGSGDVFLSSLLVTFYEDDILPFLSHTLDTPLQQPPACLKYILI